MLYGILSKGNKFHITQQFFFYSFRIGGTGCQAYFSVGTRKHKLFVRQYDMQHNHPAFMEPPIDPDPTPVSSALPTELIIAQSPRHCSPPPLPPLPAHDFNVRDDLATMHDCTADFLRIFRGASSFESFAELQARMDEFQLVTGNRYVKTNTRRLPSSSPLAHTIVYSHLVYICYRYGNQVSEAKQRKQQR